MQRLKLLGFAAGDSFSLSATQNGHVAGPVPVADWQDALAPGAVPTGGTLAIVPDRTLLACAPDSVRFWVDLSGTAFDTPAPAPGEIYDARLHRLIFLWDFGDGGSWDKPERLLEGWRDSGVAKGPFVSHVYKTPGSFTVSLLVLEPASGKWAEAHLDLTVADPGNSFAGSNTICINPAGDGDFTGAPVGARLVNADVIDEALINAYAPADKAGTPTRYLFKRGASYTSDILLKAGAPYMMTLGAYGSGDRPRMLARTDTDEAAEVWARAVYVFGTYGSLNGSFIPELRIHGLDFVGNFDPTTMATAPRDSADLDGVSVNGVLIQKYVDVLIDDCTFSGFQRSTIGFNVGGYEGKVHCHINDCALTDFGGEYPIIGGCSEHPRSTICATGNSLAQNPGAPTTYDDQGDFSGGSSKAPIRFDHGQNMYVAGNDFFHTDLRQPCIKAQNSPKAEGSIVNLHSNVMEFGYYLIDIGGNSSNTIGTSTHNIIVDGVVGLGGYSTRGIVLCNLTGATVRNVSGIIPATPFYFTDTWAFVVTEKKKTPGAAVLAAPIEVYNNTFCVLRSQDQQYSGSPDSVPFHRDPGGDFTGVVTQNNVIHEPAMDAPVTTYAPLSTELFWPPRSGGKRSPVDFSLDTTYAPPSDSWMRLVPLPGSAALGAALSGLAAYQDPLLQPRPEPPSAGAWEAD